MNGICPLAGVTIDEAEDNGNLMLERHGDLDQSRRFRRPCGAVTTSREADAAEGCREGGGQTGRGESTVRLTRQSSLSVHSHELCSGFSNPQELAPFGIHITLAASAVETLPVFARGSENRGRATSDMSAATLRQSPDLFAGRHQSLECDR